MRKQNFTPNKTKKLMSINQTSKRELQYNIFKNNMVSEKARKLEKSTHELCVNHRQILMQFLKQEFHNLTLSKDQHLAFFIATENC